MDRTKECVYMISDSTLRDIVSYNDLYSRELRISSDIWLTSAPIADVIFSRIEPNLYQCIDTFYTEIGDVS